MDKFDQSIKQAKQSYEPSSNFVEVTMRQINNRQPRKRWGIKLWAPALAAVVAVIAIIFVALPSASQKAAGPGSSVAHTGQQPSPENSSVATPPGTDNASLASDLNGIENSQNQENSDQSDANSALNDSSQQVIVPTD